MAVNLNAWDFPCFITLTSHACNCSFRIPPQSFLFPITNIALAFWKTPWVGNLPTKLLKERFKYSRTESCYKSVGISPDKLFREKSAYWRSFKEAKDRGMFPWNELPCKERFIKLKQSPMVRGISLDSLDFLLPRVGCLTMSFVICWFLISGKKDSFWVWLH